jgi:hypothetical protein
MLSRNLKTSALWLVMLAILVAAVLPAIAEESKDPSQPIKNVPCSPSLPITAASTS